MALIPMAVAVARAARLARSPAAREMIDTWQESEGDRWLPPASREYEPEAQYTEPDPGPLSRFRDWWSDRGEQRDQRRALRRARVGGGVSPRISGLTPEDSADLLGMLYRTNIRRIQSGTPMQIGAALQSGQLRYIRSDPGEEWQTIDQVWASGGGDCEDLAAAYAAELTMRGVPAHPVIYKVRPGLYHVVVQLQNGQRVDPSVMGGMGRP